MNWDYGLIKLHADAARRVADSGYPLLSNILYGDYTAAVDLMRPYSATEIFSVQTPLVVGTTAETWVPELTGAITQSATSALTLKSDLAPAYFLRGRASYLADPVANRAQARADVEGPRRSTRPTHSIGTRPPIWRVGRTEKTILYRGDMAELTHLDARGQAHMVDVGAKAEPSARRSPRAGC